MMNNALYTVGCIMHYIYSIYTLHKCSMMMTLFNHTQQQIVCGGGRCGECVEISFTLCCCC
jgi:hypothetical protein